MLTIIRCINLICHYDFIFVRLIYIDVFRFSSMNIMTISVHVHFDIVSRMVTGQGYNCSKTKSIVHSKL